MFVNDKKFLRFATALCYSILIVLILIGGWSIYEYIIGKEKLGANSATMLIGILTLIILKRDIQSIEENMKLKDSP